MTSIRDSRFTRAINDSLSSYGYVEISKLQKEFAEYTLSEIERKIRQYSPTLLEVFGPKAVSLGKLQTYEQIHSTKTLHMAVQVIVLTPNDKIILRKRRKNNKWDISASGHLLVGETPIIAAQRVLSEKLDLNLSVDRFIRVPAPGPLRNVFLKWGRLDSTYEPCYSKHDQIFRYRGHDKENYEQNELFVVRARPDETQAYPEKFKETAKVKSIVDKWAEEIAGDIDQNPQDFASGARQYFQDHDYRQLVIDRIWRSSRPVYAFDYDHTLEKKGWPLNATMANTLARLIINKSARIAIMSAKAMGEPGDMPKAVEELRDENRNDIANEIAQALQQGHGIMEYASTKILREIETLTGMPLESTDTENWLILFPAKSNAKYKLVGNTFARIEEKAISKDDVNLVIEVIKKTYKVYLPQSQDLSVLDHRQESAADLSQFDEQLPHLEMFSANGQDQGVAKILVRPFGKSSLIDEDKRKGFVGELRKELGRAGLPDLEVDRGGTSAVDITPVGKSYGIENLFATDRHSEIFYFGDEPGGSDRSVFELRDKFPGLKLFDVSENKEEETKEILEYILQTYPAHR